MATTKKKPITIADFVAAQKKLDSVVPKTQPFAHWFAGGRADVQQPLNPPDEKDIPKLINNLNIQRPYPAPVAAPAPLMADFRQADAAQMADPTQPLPGDNNGDGKIDEKDLPTVTTNPDTGEVQYTFNESQFQKMLANFTTNLINPNSNIDGAPQTKWTTYDTEAQAIQAQAAQQQQKDQALAALAAMKNS